jgi:hypothetical protein
MNTLHPEALICPSCPPAHAEGTAPSSPPPQKAHLVAAHAARGGFPRVEVFGKQQLVVDLSPQRAVRKPVCAERDRRSVERRKSSSERRSPSKHESLIQHTCNTPSAPIELWASAVPPLSYAHRAQLLRMQGSGVSSRLQLSRGDLPPQ